MLGKYLSDKKIPVFFGCVCVCVCVCHRCNTTDHHGNKPFAVLADVCPDFPRRAFESIPSLAHPQGNWLLEILPRKDFFKISIFAD